MVLQAYAIAAAIRHAFLKPPAAAALEQQRLSGIVHYAHQHAAYYRRAWKGHDRAVKNKDDLTSLPPVSRKEIAQHYRHFISDEYRRYTSVLSGRLLMQRTSGTAGRRLAVYFNPEAQHAYDAAYARALFSIGYHPAHPILYYWWQQKPQTQFYHTLGLFRKRHVPRYFSEEQQLAHMQQVRPAYLYYYPSALYFISRLIAHRGKEMPWKPRAIVTHAEMLSETMRDAIERAFGAPVYDHYAAAEFNVIAWECRERHGYHINDTVVVEVVDEQGEPVRNGETGRVLVTSLVNKAFPLIRYDIGDYAVQGDRRTRRHSCGTSLPCGIRSIEGRIEHSLRRNGTVITQKRMLDDMLHKLDSNTAMYKFQSRLGRNDVIVHAVPFERPHIGNDGLNITETINKNKKTGKTLLVERA